MFESRDWGKYPELGTVSNCSEREREKERERERASLYFILFSPESAELKTYWKGTSRERDERKLLNVPNVLHPQEEFMDQSWLCEQPLQVDL